MTGETPENWAEKPDSAVHEEAAKLYKLIVAQFRNQSDQAERITEYWNIYNAMPDENLMYAGNSQGYVPAVRDCINARAKRALKQLFPANHRHVEGVSTDGKPPYTALAMIEHYVRSLKLSSIVRSDLIAGDVTGQWNLLLDWTKTVRHATNLVKRNPIVEELGGENVEELGLADPSEEFEDTEDEEIVDEGPDIVDFATEDLAVVPPTVNDLQKAKVVALRLRLSLEAVEALVEQGTFILPEEKSVKDWFEDRPQSKEKDGKNRPKKQAEDAGVKTEGTDKYLLAFMAYAKLDFGDGKQRSAVIYFAGENEILGLIKNPLWSAKIPIISEPVDRVKGSFLGKSKIEPVKFMQWNLTDYWNMGQDAAAYSLLPIWAVDPMKNPQWASLVMGLAAVWPIDPNSVKSLTAPQLYKDAMQMCDGIKRQIMESMDVNEMMLGRMPAGRKNNQLMGQMQQEQATNITDHASRYEEVILNPLVEFLFEFDQQYRDKDVTVQALGELGAEATLKEVPPQQWGERIFFRWLGTAFMQNMQRTQQQIALMNVLKGIPPQLMAGRRLDITPILEAITENTFGPELGPKILIDERNMFSLPPEIEDEIMTNSMPVQVHEADDDRMHLQSHMKAANATQDPAGIFKAHMAAHMAAMQAKREKAMAMQQGQPGGPGGAGPGVAGAPKPGAMPAPGGPRPAQNPPGAIQQDNMAGAPGRG
jgi:hypothetical protein